MDAAPKTTPLPIYPPYRNAENINRMPQKCPFLPLSPLKQYIYTSAKKQGQIKPLNATITDIIHIYKTLSVPVIVPKHGTI